MERFIEIAKKSFVVIVKWTKSFCSYLSKGFFFYVSLFFELLGRIFKTRFFVDINEKTKSLQGNPTSALVFVALFICCLSVTSTNFNLTSSLYNGKNGNVYLNYRGLDNNNINYKSLKKTNDEFVGWINISGVNCNYPIVQTKDNDFYLNHDYLKNESNNGWIYMDYRNKFNFSDKITVIYGNKLMFEMNKIFNDQWLSDSSKTISIKDGTSNHSYKIFSVVYTKDDIKLISETYRGKVVYKDFLDDVIERSEKDLEVKVSDRDSIIVLVSDMENDYKSYVFAKKVN